MTVDQTRKDEILKRALKSVGSSVLTHSGFVRQANPRAVLRYLGYIRDEQMWQMPFLSGAAMVFQQLSSGREWHIIGRPRPALRAVDWLNSAESHDVNTGYVFYGFEEYLKRRAIDFISIGRTAFYVDGRTTTSNKIKPLEYIDPVLTAFNRSDRKVIKATDKIWEYADGRTFRSGDVIMSNTLPVGGAGIFLSPVSFVLPAALLAWLLQEHDTASLDGRRIRDVIIVGDPNLGEALEQAILTQVAIASGEDPNDVGIPVVQMTNLSGLPIADNISTLGLSKIPESFNREEFVFSYVNQISSILGLSLRHFWNSERTTNKALEEIQEQRQMQKGPSSFVRTEQNLINESGILNKFVSPTSRERLSFAFVEEVDASRAKVNAEVLKATAEALATVQKVFGASISLSALLSWMQSLYVMPSDLELVDDIDMSGENSLTSNAPTNLPQEDEVVTSGDDPNASGASETTPQKSVQSRQPDYGEVVVDQYGRIRERRRKLFHVRKILSDEIKKDMGIVPDDIKSFEDSILDTQLNNRKTMTALLGSKRGEIESWSQVQKVFKTTLVDSLLSGTDEITDELQTIIDYIVGEFSDD